MGGFDEMCTLHAVIMLWVFGWQGLANRSMRIQDLYVGAFPIPRFIKNNPIRGGGGCVCVGGGGWGWGRGGVWGGGRWMYRENTCQKSPTIISKESYYSFKRDLL